MNPKAIQALIAFVGMILLGMFLAQWIVTLPAFLQIFATSVFVLLALLLLIKPKVGVDVKFLSFVCLGYAIGGKGFAYVSPFEPFFVSEVALMLCLTGFLLRAPSNWSFLRGQKYGLWILFIFISFCGLRLGLYDFPKYKMLAIRDSAIAYYGLFVFTTIIACRNDDNFFLLKGIFIPMGFLGLLGEILMQTGILIEVYKVFPYAARIVFPFADISGPLVAAFVITSFFIGITERKILFLFLSVVALVFLLNLKTAGVFGLIVLIGTLVLFTGRKELIMTGFLSIIMGFVIFAVIIVSGYELEIDSAHLDTIESVGDFKSSGNSSTTEWRLTWWRIIVEDTWEQAPLSGAGFGGDISSAFYAEVFGVDTKKLQAGVDTSRYPHNIFFTVLGRLGIPVAFFFLAIQIGIWLRLGRYAQIFFSKGKPDFAFLMAISFVIAGIANGFVQATYEPPYAAIPHWVTLGFIYGYIQRWRKGLPLMAPPKVKRRP